MVAAVPGQDGPATDLDSLTDHARLKPLATGERVTVKGVALDDETVDLRLERFEATTPDATLVVVGEEGPRPFQPEVVLLRGTVEGEPDSHVFAGVSAHGTHGFVRRAGSLHFLSTGPAGGDFAMQVSDAAKLPDVQLPVEACGLDQHPLEAAPPEPRNPGGVAGGDPPCRVAKVAVETDWEYTEFLFNEDVQAAGEYAITLMAAVSEIYEADLNASLLISYLRLWEVNADPYNQGASLHNEFRDWWNNYESEVDRNVAHLLSGRTNLPYGGIAWLNGLCSGSAGYGVSAYLNASFPYPLQDNHGGNWDLVVVAHELGHNFGTIHTHDFNPPIDGCAFGQCAEADQGTIMSYCHTCEGGIANILLDFHPQVETRILNFLAAVGCDLEAGEPTAVDDVASTIGGGSVLIDVLLNDAQASCGPAVNALASFDSETVTGGTIELVPATYDFPRDRLLYTAPLEFNGVDSFGYMQEGGLAATVHVDVFELRQPDLTGPTEPGLKVSYFELSSPSQLPDFDGLTSYLEDVVPRLQYPSTDGDFATSGLADEVGAVFEGYFKAPLDDLYSLYLNSDDGSKLSIGDELVVDNDGLHGMVTQGGQIALAAGWHEIRVEFFENGGGAGLIATFGTPTHPPSVIPNGLFSHGIGDDGPGFCPADINGDSTVNVTDLTAVVVNWGADGGEADLNEDGTVDVMDLMLVIVEWGDC